MNNLDSSLQAHNKLEKVHPVVSLGNPYINRKSP